MKLFVTLSGNHVSGYSRRFPLVNLRSKNFSEAFKHSCSARLSQIVLSCCIISRIFFVLFLAQVIYKNLTNDLRVKCEVCLCVCVFVRARQYVTHNYFFQRYKKSSR